MHSTIKTGFSSFPCLPCPPCPTIKARLSSFHCLPPVPHLASDTGKIPSAFLHELRSLLQGLTTRRWTTMTNPIKTGLSSFPCLPPVSHFASNTCSIPTAFLHELSSLLGGITRRWSTSTNSVGLLLWNVVQCCCESKIEQKQNEKIGLHHPQVWICQ